MSRIPQSLFDAAAVNRPLRGRVAIAGAATYGCGEAPGMDDMTLLVRAAQAAVQDAGLSMQDIDGLATCSVNASMWTMPVIEHLGINPTYVDGTMIGGAMYALDRGLHAKWAGAIFAFLAAVCAFGIGYLAPGHLIDTARVHELSMVNIESVIVLLKHAFPLLLKGEHPAVVLMSSTMGLVGAAGMSAYSATKGAVSSLARSLAVEWAPRKIRVNAVAPGVVMSPLVSQMFSVLTTEQVQAIERRYPLGFGQPEDAANAVRFLLSPEAKWLTGVVLPVDGGYTAH